MHIFKHLMRLGVKFLGGNYTPPKAVFSSQKFLPSTVKWHAWTHAWSTKYRQNKKLITQFSEKSRDESFKPN
jgi:hypothetical protein